MVSAVWPALLATSSFLTTNLSSPHLAMSSARCRNDDLDYMWCWLSASELSKVEVAAVPVGIGILFVLLKSLVVEMITDSDHNTPWGDRCPQREWDNL